MKNYLLSLLTGLLCGGVFSIFNLPIPAPLVFEGIMGIIGIWGGYMLVKLFIK